MSLLEKIESILGNPELSIDPFTGNIIRKDAFKFRCAEPFDLNMMCEILDLYLNALSTPYLAIKVCIAFRRPSTVTKKHTAPYLSMHVAATLARNSGD